MDLRNVPILIWLMAPDSRVLLLQVHQDRDSQVVQVFRVLCGDHLVGADRVGAAMDQVPVLMTGVLVGADRVGAAMDRVPVLMTGVLVGADRVGAAMDHILVGQERVATVSDPLAIRGVTHFRNASVNGRQPVLLGVQVLTIGRDRAATGELVQVLTDTIGAHLKLDPAATIIVLDFVQTMMVDYYQIKVVEGNVLPLNHQLVLIVVDGFQPI